MDQLANKKACIFLVDDEPDICEFFKLYLDSDSIEVKIFTNPEEAIIQSKIENPSIVFLDYRLKSVTGYCRRPNARSHS
jgi:DNA-binding response OmpR family regulator